ncbi:MAG: hypothetical protein ACRBK7_14590 [Acidimicrobiales bacterium]
MRSISEADARYLRLSKAELQTTVDVAGRQATAIHQFGGAYLPDAFPIAPIAVDHAASEPIIETFVIDQDGSCTGTGSDQALIDAWLPAVQEMSRRVIDAMASLEVRLAGAAYLTASLTPLGEVTDTPHFDDDQYVEGDGIGLVAIAASHGGPRIATEPVPCGPVRSGLPLEVSPETFDRFADQSMAAAEAEADRIVVFPQFGQLHSGPSFTADTLAQWGSGQTRRLLVLRAQTVPDVRAGSRPT